MSSSEPFRAPTHIRCISVNGLTSSSISAWVGLTRIVGSCMSTSKIPLVFWSITAGIGLAMGHAYTIAKSDLNARRPKNAQLEKMVLNQETMIQSLD